MTKNIKIGILAACLFTGCQGGENLLSGAACGGPACGEAAAPVTALTGASDEIKRIPAVDRDRYPDSIGYLYRGDLATVLWLQNERPAEHIEELDLRLRRRAARGVTGEIVADTLQPVAPVTGGPPSLEAMIVRTTQMMRLMSQLSTVSQDYGHSLSTALDAYNTGPERQRTLAETAARVEAAFASVTPVSPGAPAPRPAPPAARRVVKPGRYFAEAVEEGRRSYLQTTARVLQQAIQSRDTAGYGSAFTDVFYAQLDPAMSGAALDALAVSHQAGILKGQPLDAVIGQFIPRPDRGGHELSMEQLRLINQVNLISNDPAESRIPLIAALLLTAEDRRLGEQDPELSAVQIGVHIHDTPWLVAQYVRVKGDGTTEQAVLAMLETIAGTLNNAH